MASSEPPPLPWGSNDEGNAVPDAQEEDMKLTSVPLGDARLAPGDKIEVSICIMIVASLIWRPCVRLSRAVIDRESNSNFPALTFHLCFR
jgi:hypothetical protein